MIISKISCVLHEHLSVHHLYKPQQCHLKSQRVFVIWKSNLDPTLASIATASSSKHDLRHILEKKGNERRTCSCPSSIHHQHPRHDFVGHPIPKFWQHCCFPLTGTGREHICLYMFIPHTSNDALVSIKQTKDFEYVPYFPTERLLRYLWIKGR